MPKGAKKRAKLKKKKQQQGHPDDGGNANANNGNGNGNGNGSDDNNAWSRRDVDHHHQQQQRIPPNVDASEDSMESSEEMVTPRAAGSEADEEERKAAASEVTVEHAIEGDDAGEEFMVDALPPEAGEQERPGKVHALVKEPEVKDVLVAEEASVMEVPEVKREVAKVHPVYEPEPKVDEVVVVEETQTPEAPVVQEPEVKGDGIAVREMVSAPLVKEPEMKGGNVVAKDSAEVSRTRETADVHTTEVVRGPAVALAASGQRVTWWNCCGLFDAFTGSER